MWADRFISLAVVGLAGSVLGQTSSVSSGLPWIQETPVEFIGSGDFDGDSRTDVIIADKTTGKYRLGYQVQPGAWKWVGARSSGVKDLTGLSVGKVRSDRPDALAFVSAHANRLCLVDASDVLFPSRPAEVPLDCLGPARIAFLDMNAAGFGLVIWSIYNTDPNNLVTAGAFRNGYFQELGNAPSSPPVGCPNRISLTPDEPEMLAGIFPGEKGGGRFLLQRIVQNKVTDVIDIELKPATPAKHYVVRHSRDRGVCRFICHSPGSRGIVVIPVDSVAGKLRVGNTASFELPDPVEDLIALGERWLAIQSGGSEASICTLDEGTGPQRSQNIAAGAGRLFTGGVAVGDGFLLLSRDRRAVSRISDGIERFVWEEGRFSSRGFSSLPSLQEDDARLCVELHRRVLDNLVVQAELEMRPYTNTLPFTSVSYAMVPIPSGVFLMGSPTNEPGRSPDEGPQRWTRISPFWMGQCEVTWQELELYMFPLLKPKLWQSYIGKRQKTPLKDELADLYSVPSEKVWAYNFCKPGYPAVAVDRLTAIKYCQWLSGKLGEFYRLPTEAEWEYACRAGTTSPYFFGSDAAKLGEHAWFEGNSESRVGDLMPHKVGLKKPNPWGLHDILGNVSEWCLDQHAPYLPAQKTDGPSINPWIEPSMAHPLVVRGGSYDDEASRLRSAARGVSSPNWKEQDPIYPKSRWWLSDAPFVGFRLVRPLEVPSAREMQRYWNNGWMERSEQNPRVNELPDPKRRVTVGSATASE